ncbi:hypothetical protein U9M48_018541 [Paspalum notatum var. saurae]|uniref:Leucine-rich repeat-containing N-terminal plant-type domain-containing protein n=1 Tax=Paspalum notatum var. saurae TaxID=547442 RepID=A0AAQ3TDS9_PASNO
MEAGAALRLLLTIAISVSSAYAAQTQPTAAGCIAEERNALLSFRAGIASDPQNLLASWSGQDCCQWRGVECSNSTGHVIKLDLRNKFFLDDFVAPFYSPRFRGMSGKISSALVSLQHLKYLDLSGNHLGGEGVAIPGFLGSLQTLMYLNLSSMNFVGTVPPQLGNLSRLQYLDLDNDYYSYYGYYLRSEDISWLPRLCSLRFLDMCAVNLTTIGNWAQVVNMLSSLRALRLCECHLAFPYTPTTVHPNLTSLEMLDLSDNWGVDVLNSTYWFWQPDTMRHLDLTNNMAARPFPDAVANMTSLEVLRLGGNQLSDVKAKPLKNLCNLRELALWSNYINQDMSEFLEGLPPCAWSKLELLDLSLTNISGKIPNSISQWTNLRSLQLSANRLLGSIPLEIGMLNKLTILYLDYNQFNGSILEEHLAGLVNLEELDISYNSLHMMIRSNWIPRFKLTLAYFPRCKIGPHFPLWLKDQTDVRFLDISDAGIVDILPDWFWRVLSNVQYLNVSFKLVQGYHGHCSLCPQLRYLTSTPTTSQLPRHLVELDISRNSLSGPLPQNIGAPNLSDLLLSDNDISGAVPRYICQLKGLSVLDLAKNNLVGQLPICLEGSEETPKLYLVALILYGNNLSGKFPSVLQRCPELVLLDLANNKYSGELPTWIANKLPNLSYLRLRNNTFSGSIPFQLTELRYLQFLDLAHNRISGSMPHKLSNMKAMAQDDYHKKIWDNPLSWSYARPGGSEISGEKYDDSLEVVMKGQYLDYTSNIIYMVALDLSHNNLVGEIPNEITSLVGLRSLNISYNQLSSKIPEEIGQLRSLESFDLSWNKLSGKIPSSLSDITTLSKLNLSYNNLTGRIPIGNQLQSLVDPASSYIGNNYLCGPPVSRNCSVPQLAKGNLDEYQSDSEVRYLYLGMDIGFVLGLWVVFVTFLFARTWRTAYFQLCDKLLCSIETFLTSNSQSYLGKLWK